MVSSLSPLFNGKEVIDLLKLKESKNLFPHLRVVKLCKTALPSFPTIYQKEFEYRVSRDDDPHGH